MPHWYCLLLKASLYVHTKFVNSILEIFGKKLPYISQKREALLKLQVFVLQVFCVLMVAQNFLLLLVGIKALPVGAKVILKLLMDMLQLFIAKLIS